MCTNSRCSVLKAFSMALMGLCAPNVYRLRSAAIILLSAFSLKTITIICTPITTLDFLKIDRIPLNNWPLAHSGIALSSSINRHPHLKVNESTVKSFNNFSEGSAFGKNRKGSYMLSFFLYFVTEKIFHFFLFFQPLWVHLSVKVE